MRHSSPPPTKFPIQSKDIAIIGIGCRYPGGANSPEQLWQLLIQGKDGFSAIPESRWNKSRHFDPNPKTPARTSADEAALLEDKYLFDFDADFFGFVPLEAGSTDPQQRLLHEVCWECLEDAGIPARDLKGGNVGVYVGAFTTDNQVLRSASENVALSNQFSAYSSSFTMLSNRLSYFFDFHGPSLTIDTACSGSMVAFNYACQDLWSGKSDAAIVAGVNAIFYPTFTTYMTKGGFLAKDNRSKAFDVKADGYARGEGAGCILIKRLSNALEDNDEIYAVVKGVGVNQDGKTIGISAPNGKQQEVLIRSIFEEFSLDRDNVVMVEAHGTGTALGDPTEISALGNALGQRIDEAPRLISSIKGNIGHQEGGAGVAGIIKSALCLKHDAVPPQCSFSELNPKLNMAKGGFSLVTSPQKLPSTAGQPLASINSFGYGGTNAHVVLGRWDEESGQLQSFSEENSGLPFLLGISGQSEEALGQRIRDLKVYLEKEGSSLAYLSHLLLNNFDCHDYRIAFAASTKDQALSILYDLINLEDLPEGIESGLLSKPSNEIVFLYTGMGPQWWAMGRELYQQSSVFREALKEADNEFENHSGWSILAEILKEEGQSEMASNRIAQPANFVLQYALTKLLEQLGLRPSLIIGHSVGEVGAAVAAGSLSLSDAALVAYHRSKLQQTKAGQGHMLATGLDLETAQEIIELYQGTVSIGAINSDSSITLSGDHEDLNNIRGELIESDIFAKIIFGEVAYHSHQMDELEEELLDALKGLRPLSPQKKLYSTVTAQLVDGAIHDGDYWWHNVRQPVQFKRAMEGILDEGYRHFIEIGPNPVLSAAIQQICTAREIESPLILPSLVRNREEIPTLYGTLARFWCAGTDLSHPNHPRPSARNLPHYPWHRVRHWNETKASQLYRSGAEVHPLSGMKIFSPTPTWEANLSSASMTLLKDHIINARPIFPAAAYLETFLSVAMQSLGKEGCSLNHINFDAILPLPEGDTLQTRVSHEENILTFHARLFQSDGDWKPYASARLLQKSVTRKSANLDGFENISLGKKYERSDIYEVFNYAGLNYGPVFEVIEEAFLQDGRAKGFMKISRGAAKFDKVHIQPGILDGAFQLLALLALDEEKTYLPSFVSQFHLLNDVFPDQVFAYAKRTAGTDLTIIADITITDLSNNPLAIIVGAKAQAIPQAKSKAESVNQYKMVWRAREIKVENLPIFCKDVLGPSSAFKEAVEDCFAGSHQNSSRKYVFWASDHAKTIVPSHKDGWEFTNHAQQLDGEENVFLVLCTKNTWHINPEDEVMPGSADLWGIARTIRQEVPKLKVICVDFDDAPGNLPHLKSCLEQLEDGGEFAYRNRKFYQRHLVNLNDIHQTENHHVPYRADLGAYLEVQERGGIEALEFRAQTRRQPINDEIEVEFCSMSLNFKDVLKVFGRLTAQSLEGTFIGKGVGMEGTGRVIRKGPDSNLNIGEEVICIVRGGCFSRFATFAPKDALIARCEHLNLPPASKATIGISYGTAHYCLKHAGRLRENETVLLHSATGGVGQAAIQVARSIGAKIIATAGTPKKRDYLRELGLDHVFDSRCLDFEQKVLEITDGDGVDVILNFLPEDLLHASVRLLAPFGRLVELGKYDIGLNKGLPLGEFERNQSFISFDLDNLLNCRLNYAHKLLDEILEQHLQGVYEPKSIHTYPAKNVKEAFRELAAGNHIGKRVIELSEPTEFVLPPLAGNASISKEATYLVTGAFGGLGLTLAEWLVDEGAGAVILCGRQIRQSSDLGKIKNKAQKKSCLLYEMVCDVGSEVEVQKTLAGDYQYPIRGVFHTAAQLLDGAIKDQSEESFFKAYYAKALGAYNLHQSSLAEALELDYFVLYSSVSATLGNPGQVNYAGANSYLDGLAEHRRQLGLPAISLAWGAIGDVGIVARNPGLEHILSARGINPIPIDQALKHLKQALAGSAENTCIFNLDWSKWDASKKPSSDIPYFDFLNKSQEGALKERLLGKLAKLSEEEGLAAIQEFLVKELAKILHLYEGKIRPDQTLVDLGLDSLMAVELQIRLEGEMADLVSADVLDMQKSVSSIAKNLYQNFLSVPEDCASTIADQALGNVDHLEEEEVDALLESLMREEKEGHHVQ